MKQQNEHWAVKPSHLKIFSIQLLMQTESWILCKIIIYAATGKLGDLMLLYIGQITMFWVEKSPLPNINLMEKLLQFLIGILQKRVV